MGSDDHAVDGNWEGIELTGRKGSGMVDPRGAAR